MHVIKNLYAAQGGWFNWPTKIPIKQLKISRGFESRRLRKIFFNLLETTQSLHISSPLSNLGNSNTISLEDYCHSEVKFKCPYL